MKKTWVLSLASVSVALVVVFIYNKVPLGNILGISAGLADSSWPMYHAGVGHGGQSSVDTSHVDGTLKWKFEAGGAIESSPAIGSDGTIYVGSHDNKLYAINPDGTQKWEFAAGEPIYDDEFDVIKGIVSSPAVAADGTIYFSSLSDYFFAINPDGTEKWRLQLPFSRDTWTSPAIDSDGTIYTGTARRFTEGSIEVFDSRELGGLYAINPDGTEKWSLISRSDIAPSPAIAPDGTIYYGTYETQSDGFLIAVDRDGVEKWRYDTGALIESSAAIGPDGTLYVGSKNGKVFAINPDGTKKWSFQTNDGVSAIPALGADGTVYVGSWDYHFYAIDSDGNEKWRAKTPEAYEGIVAAAAIGKEGTVYIGSNGGVFYAFNPNGTEKWSYDAKSSLPSSPAIGPDGTVYAGAWDKNLYAFGGPDKSATVRESNVTLFEPEVLDSISMPSVVVAVLAVLAVVGGGVLIKIGKLSKKHAALILLALLIVFAFLKLSKEQLPKDFSREDPNFFGGRNSGRKANPNACLMNEKYSEVTDPNAPVLSIPFNPKDYTTKHWGIIPFCAKIRNGQIHSALDFELKPNSKVFASTDGEVESAEAGDAEGAGDVIVVQGDGFSLGYSGLTDLRVKPGDKIKRGDLIAKTKPTPYGEHHVHLGINTNGGQECPIKYMDGEFRQEFEKMFALADYGNHTDAPCACNCEFMPPDY